MAQSVCLILGNRREIIWQNRKNVICRTVSNHVEKNAFIKSCVSYRVRWCRIVSDCVRWILCNNSQVYFVNYLSNIVNYFTFLDCEKFNKKKIVKSFTKKIVKYLSNIVKSVTKNIVNYLSRIVNLLSKLVKKWTMILWNNERTLWYFTQRFCEIFIKLCENFIKDCEESHKKDCETMNKVSEKVN